MKMTKNISVGADRKYVLQTLLRAAVFLLILFAVTLTILSINQRHGKDLVLDDTQALDLSAWNFERQGMNFLESGWQFYPNQLLIPSDFRENSPSFQNDLPRHDDSSLRSE